MPSHFKHSNESSRTPHPLSGSTTPASVYNTVSMSGQIRSPCNSMSSPVLAMTVILLGSIASTRPVKNLAAPIPPASAVTVCGRDARPFLLFSIRKSQKKSIRWLQTNNPEPSCFDLIAAVDSDCQHRHSFDYSRPLQPACIHWP